MSKVDVTELLNIEQTIFIELIYIEIRKKIIDEIGYILTIMDPHVKERGDCMNPVALEFGPLAIHWYGIIMASAFGIGTWLAYWRAKRESIHPEHIIDMLIWIVPAAIVGARLYYVLFEWDRYAGNLFSIIAVWEGGLAIHGGLIGGLLAGIVYCKKHDLPLLRMTDILVPSVILGQAIGRWGNFMNQEAHGGPVSESFIIYFPQFIQTGMYIQGQYMHPTFLYESLWNLGIFVLLLFLWSKRSYDGQMTLLYVSLYSVGRFFIEGLRTDSLMVGPLQIAQVISLVLIVLAVIGMWMLSRKKHVIESDPTNMTSKQWKT